MIANTGVDASKVYVAGLSAGAGLPSVLVAAHPELFQAAAIALGFPAQCATSREEIAVSGTGFVRSAVEWGNQLARRATRLPPYSNRGRSWRG